MKIDKQTAGGRIINILGNMTEHNSKPTSPTQSQRVWDEEMNRWVERPNKTIEEQVGNEQGEGKPDIRNSIRDFYPQTEQGGGEKLFTQKEVDEIVRKWRNADMDVWQQTVDIYDKKNIALQSSNDKLVELKIICETMAAVDWKNISDSECVGRMRTFSEYLSKALSSLSNNTNKEG